MTEQPLVSICIPVLNGARHLPAALQSALSQSYPNIEVVAVDNRSDDETPSILKSFAASHGRRLRVFRNERTLDMVGNFNEAASHARGEYLKILPHDDVLTPTSIESLLREREPGDGLIVGLRTFIFEEAAAGRRFFYRNLNRFWRADRRLGVGKIAAERYAETVAANTTHNVIGEPGNVLIARDAFDAVGGFTAGYHQLCDLRLWHAIALQRGLRVVARTVCQFRVHGQSQSSASREADNTALLREHFELSDFVVGSLRAGFDQDLIRRATVNLALDAARLRAADAQHADAGVEPALDRLAERIRHFVPAKRVYQLLALKAVCAIRQTP